MQSLPLQQTFDAALQQHRAGRLLEAQILFERILSQSADHFGALHCLGAVLQQQGKSDQAIKLLARAADARPAFAELQNDLGSAFLSAGRVSEAISAHQRAIAIKPGLIAAHLNLGNALHCVGRFDEAIASYKQAIALQPDYVEAINNLGIVLGEQGKFAEAVTAFRGCIALKPDYGQAHSNLGNILRTQKEYAEAIASHRRAIALNPTAPDSHYNLGNALAEDGQRTEAIAAYRQAIALKPDNPYAHNNLAYQLLADGDFENGWKEIEWRLLCGQSQFPRQNLLQPQWDGSPLNSKRILLQTELGFGDTIQFIRYWSILAERGGSVIVECQPELQRLFATAGEDLEVVARGQPLPEFDLHCPLLSLPRLLGTTLETIPNRVPYLHPDAENTSKWKRRLAELAPAFNVGLAWAGSATNPHDANRSTTLANLAPLALIPGVRFFSLQKGPAAAQTKSPPAGMVLIDWSDEFRDFSDADLIANLDLTVTVDTAVAHLAGAMAKPVWTLLSALADWRWMDDREDTPWYPSMRLFRQSAKGDWNELLNRVAQTLHRHIQERI